LLWLPPQWLGLLPLPGFASDQWPDCHLPYLPFGELSMLKQIVGIQWTMMPVAALFSEIALAQANPNVPGPGILALVAVGVVGAIAVARLRK
jgi:hypothetical protein